MNKKTKKSTLNPDAQANIKAIRTSEETIEVHEYITYDGLHYHMKVMVGTKTLLLTNAHLPLVCTWDKRYKHQKVRTYSQPRFSKKTWKAIYDAIQQTDFEYSFKNAYLRRSFPNEVMLKEFVSKTLEDVAHIAKTGDLTKTYDAIGGNDTPQL